MPFPSLHVVFFSTTKPSELPLAYGCVSTCVRPTSDLMRLPWTTEVHMALRVSLLWAEWRDLVP